MLKLESKIAVAEIAHSRPDLVCTYVQRRVDCQRIGHALSHRAHDADRWIAATAVRLGIPFVSNDGIFRGVPGLELEILTSI